ncbi:MAG: hypothetical protein C0502_08145 [Opitutus sp.]|nr:hypothetical protein [Opitutus sp.]
MKRLLMLLAVVVLVGAGSYGAARLLWPAPPTDEDLVAWLRREFDLTTKQAAAVEKLHRDYLPVCSNHCAIIVATREKLAEKPGDAALLAEALRLKKACQQITLAHVREVATHMSAEEGRRFLSLVEPRITRHDHQGVFGLK